MAFKPEPATNQFTHKLPSYVTDKVNPDNKPNIDRRTRGNHKVRFQLANNQVVWLTVKQRLFVSEYMIDFNAHDAALRSGYSKWSTIGQGNPMNYEAVRLAIESELELQARAAQVTANKVLAEYAKIAFADISSMVEFDKGRVKVKDTAGMPQDVTAAISEVSVTAKGQLRLKLHDKTKALDALAKHLGLFKEHNKREVTLTLEQLVTQSYAALPAAGDKPLPPPSVMAENLVKLEYDKAYGPATGSNVLDALVIDTEDGGCDDE